MVTAVSDRLKPGEPLILRVVRAGDCPGTIHRNVIDAYTGQAVWNEDARLVPGQERVFRFMVELPDLPPAHYAYMAHVELDCGQSDHMIFDSWPVPFTVTP